MLRRVDAGIRNKIWFSDFLKFLFLSSELDFFAEEIDYLGPFVYFV